MIRDYPEILKDRGETLFFGDKIELFDQSGDENTFLFNAFGSKKAVYEVEVDLSPMEDGRRKVTLEDETSCTCPYFQDHWACKHVAAAFFLLESLEVKKPQMSLWPDKFAKLNPGMKPGKDSELPLEYSVPRGGLDRISEILPDTGVQLVSMSVYKLEFLKDGLLYGAYLNGFAAEFQLTYSSKAEKLSIQLPKSRHINLPALLQFLRLRFSEKYRDQDFLTEEIRQKSKLDFLERKNLLGYLQDTDTALAFGIFGDRFGYRYSGELAGLKEVEVVQKDLKELFPKAKEEEFIQEFKGSVKAKESGRYNLGFGLSFSYHRPGLTVVPILGKGKKDDPDGLHTRIEILKDSKDYRLTKPGGVTELIYLMNTFNRMSEGREEEGYWKTGVAFFQNAREYPMYLLGPHLSNLSKVSARDLNQKIVPKEATAKICLNESAHFYELELNFTFGGEDYRYHPDPVPPRLWMGFGLLDGQFLFIRDFRQAEGLASLFKLLPFKFPKDQLHRVVEQVIQPLSAFFPFEDQLGHLQWLVRESGFQEELYINEVGGLVSFVPRVVYGDQIGINPLDPSLLSDPGSGGFVARDFEVEQSFLEFVRDLHSSFEKLAPKFHFTLNAADFSEGMWFLETFEKLKERGVKTYGLENIKIKRYSPFQAKVSMQFSSGQDWFGIHSGVSFGGEEVSLKNVRKAWENGERFIQLGDGSLGKIPEEWMKKMVRLLRAGELDGEELRLSKVHFMLLEDWEESSEFANVQLEIEEKKQRMIHFSGIREVTIPQKLQADLRAYQKSGLNWLNFLREFRWGGILADDMGLGKTIQMIALISQMEEQNPSVKVLIVASTTLLFNWKKELEKFAPHLDYFIHHGQRYDSAEDLTKHQLVLTSYGLVINDLELLQSIDWDLIVADESQAIKNTGSLRYKAMMRLRGKQRVALTGTPIENGIQELFAQMNFTNPGFFKSFHHFNEHILSPIKKGDSELIQSLKKQITPFVLRRTKKEVLTELPDKIEELLYCEMGTVQRAVYEAKREEYRNFLLKKFDEEGADQSKMFVLEGLTRLRQICDSPRLTGDTEQHSSAKIDLLREHILEKTGNHKILIFSQFVKMLDLIREQLTQSRVSYCYLDGQTSLAERERQVERFQENESVRVFLISLKAGGTGLNLTAADYVYIVDPWWNPAVENQAIDRCYRMGQEKHVVAYRMICQDSIEEKILALQASKNQLAKDIIGEGEGLLASLDRDGMLELFS